MQNKLLRLTVSNTRIQWVTENTRYREDKPSKLNLLFTTNKYGKKDINYEWPIGRSDHVVLEIEIR